MSDGATRVIYVDTKTVGVATNISGVATRTLDGATRIIFVAAKIPAGDTKILPVATKTTVGATFHIY